MNDQAAAMSRKKEYRRAQGAKSKPIPFPRFAREILETLRAADAGRSDANSADRRVKQVLGILEEDMGLTSTAELTPVPEFVDRFLTAWRGSTKHQSVVAILGVLGAIATAAVTWGHLEPSAHDVRPILIPPHWDEGHPSFRGALAGRRSPGPSRTREEFARLVAYLKHPDRSGPWEGSRLFLLVACVALGDLSPSEALALEFDDFGVGPDGPTLRIAAREGIRCPRSPAVVGIPDTLIDLRERMKPRAHSRWILPDLHRSGPWSYYGTGKLAGMASAALAKACDDAKLPAFTFKDVATLGRESDTGSLFAVTHGDGVMTLNPLEIGDLEIVVYGSFKNPITGKGPSKGTIFELDRAFRYLRKAGVVGSTGLGFLDLGERILAATGPDDPRMNAKVLKWANAICNIAIRKGHLDLAPLSGHRKPPRDPHPKGPRPHRRLLGSIAVPREAPDTVATAGPVPDPWAGWNASICPVHVRNDRHLVVFGRDKVRLRSKNAIRLFSELAGRYPGGGFDLPGLRRRFGTGAITTFGRVKKIDSDTQAAFQSPGPNKLGLYRIGPPDS
jgi:hypothetical protein